MRDVFLLRIQVIIYYLLPKFIITVLKVELKVYPIPLIHSQQHLLQKQLMR